MHLLKLPNTSPFSLDCTLGCGQVFRWNRTGGGWEGVVGQQVIRVCQDDQVLKWSGASRKFFSYYFAFDLDLPAILADIDRDATIHHAIEACKGLRIVRQTPWECLASYICATYSRIPRIRAQIEVLAQQFGNKLTPRHYSFPQPDVLATARESDIGPCRLGYRAPYLCETAGKVADDPGWEERIRSLPTDRARKELMKFQGVGEKVADCVLLFAFGRYDAFPVDVWIRRIMERYYPGKYNPHSNNQVRAAARERFGLYAGYAQEYLFCIREDLAKNMLGDQRRSRSRYSSC